MKKKPVIMYLVPFCKRIFITLFSNNVRINSVTMIGRSMSIYPSIEFCHVIVTSMSDTGV